jgi:hypothetical protein
VCPFLLSKPGELAADRVGKKLPEETHPTNTPARAVGDWCGKSPTPTTIPARTNRNVLVFSKDCGFTTKESSRMANITIAGQTFKSKELAKKRARTIMYGVQPGVPLTADERDFILGLLEKHPRRDEKVGCGVADVFVRLNPKFGKNRSFWLRRRDGSETDFSFEKCLSPVNPVHTFKSAARNTIHPQVVAARQAAFRGGPVTCPVTGVLLKHGEHHVDHEPPATFDRLLADFVRLEGLDPLTVECEGHDDGNVEKSFRDHALAARWAQYHRDHARLRVVSKNANLSQVRKAENQRIKESKTDA